MPKYIIEDGYDFYAELYKSLDLNDSNSDEECLITNCPLTENYVTLDCGHKFNYEPLFNDIMNHKKKFNTMETHILKGMEIRCPYCRNIQKKLLPYHECYETAGINKVHGVNYFDESKINTSQLKWAHGVCAHKYIISNPETNITTTACCTNKYVTNVEMIGKTYCSYHKYTAIQQHMKEKKLAEKQKIIEAKLKEKELKKQEKLKEKELKKEEKAKEKELKKQNKKTKSAPVINIDTNENIVLASTSEATASEATASEATVLCKQILHNGKNKGLQCSHKVSSNQLCLRHYKMYNNSLDKVATLHAIDAAL